MEAKSRFGESSAGFTGRHGYQGAGNSRRGIDMVATEIDSTARSSIVDMEIQQASRLKPPIHVEYQSTEAARRLNHIQY